MNFLCFALVFGLFHAVFVKVGGITKCGTSVVSFNHTSGDARTERGEWPFLAALFDIGEYQKQRFLYAGTVISNRHILTVAHGLRDIHGSELVADKILALLGAYNLNEEFEQGVIRSNVDEVYVHPDWKAISRNNDANIAILTLKQPLIFTNYVQPVCIATKNNVKRGATGYFAGWGKRKDESTLHLEFPRRGLTYALNDSFCYQIKPEIESFSSPRTFCGGRGDADPGQGDSGGGFFLRSGSSWLQYGIISAGFIGKDTISIYTNVVLFKDWMEKIVSKSGTGN